MNENQEPQGNGDSRKAVDGSKPVVVAIGASAGGVQALQGLLAALPEKTGAAFVIVMHLDPNRRSELAKVLATRTRIPVVEVNETCTMQADHIYVIPPDRRLQVQDYDIAPVEFDQPHGQRLPIDLFFRSLADQLGDGCAVVLSGAGSDGALGVRAIKEAGGIILVQDPSEAEYGSMPRSAIATGMADFVLPVRDLAVRLVELIRLKRHVRQTDLPMVDEEGLRRVLAHLRARTGHDFSKYKRSTVLRRVARRMQVVQTDTLADYYNVLRESADEAQALLGDLLISVTNFFRDASAFNLLSSSALPSLFKDKGPGEPIRVWVSGCATGEEAYTIAMLLLEEAGRHEIRPPIQVFGSDLDGRALAYAREGRYPAAIEADVNEERLRKFFVREGDQYRVRQEVRDIVLFAIHDLLKDPPFSRVDLISCRNVLIYLDRELQEQVCSTFHYALNPAGFLLLGSSESADLPTGLFRTIDRTSRLYQSTALEGERPRALPRLLGAVRIREQPGLVGRFTPTVALGEATIHRRAIEQIAPPSLLINETHRVVHLSDNAGRYICPQGGPLSEDAVDLVRTELRFELRSALHRAFEQQEPTLSLPILVQFNGSPHRVLLYVKPVEDDDGVRHAVVMFIEGEAVEGALGSVGAQPTDEAVRRLTEELDLMQTRLRTVREESDSATEELRAANEELQSINEEYRSTSEELETSKEELQSINEELQTVNSELKIKLETISRAHSDLQNLMAASDYGTLFLDSGLRIKRFTDQVTQLFSITPADEGRSLTDFAHQLDYSSLIDDAKAVLVDLAPIRREVHSRTDSWYEIRLRPYRTVDNKIDGVVITFVDVTERRQVEAALRESERNLRQQKRMVELSRDPIFIWDFDGGIVDWNRGCEELYGFTRQEALGKVSRQLLTTTVTGGSFDEVKEKLLAERSWFGELAQRAKDGRALCVESRLDLEELDGRRLVLESTHDVTDRRALQERQQLLLGELAHRVKNSLAVVQSIAFQTLRNCPTPDDFVDRFSGRLAAMGTAHGLLVQSEWRGANLASLAKIQLAPYAGDGAGRVHIEGPPVLLPADLATPFSLVLHELAANAAKYGSLSQRSGTISINWEVSQQSDGDVLRFVWREMGGPPVQESGAPGFGTVLIDSAIPGSTVRRNFRREGLVCTIELSAPMGEEDERRKTSR